MGNQEEPEYRQFEGKCQECSVDVVYHNSIIMHPSNVRCDTCEKAWIAGKITGRETFAGEVKGQG